MCGPSTTPKHGTNVFEVSSEYVLDKIRYIYTYQSYKRSSTRFISLLCWNAWQSKY